MSVIQSIVKTIVTIFMIMASIILFCCWAVLGSLLLFTLILRIIILYTIALSNAFISGTNLTHDYSSAIEDIIKIYIGTYARILSMPKLTWKALAHTEQISFEALLSEELEELKKSWVITIIIFLSYTLSFGISLAILVS